MRDVRCPDCGRSLELKYGFLIMHTRTYWTGNGTAQQICPGSRKYLPPELYADVEVFPDREPM